MAGRHEKSHCQPRAAAGSRAGSDVSNPEHVQAALEAVIKQFGRLDVMVNNAGITKDGFLVRMSEADWDAVININLKGTFLFTKQAAKVMMKQKSGYRERGFHHRADRRGQANYGASKAGVIALTKSAARNWRNVQYPGQRCRARVH